MATTAPEKKKNVSLKDIEKLNSAMEETFSANAENQSEDLFNTLNSRYLSKTQDGSEDEEEIIAVTDAESAEEKKEKAKVQVRENESVPISAGAQTQAQAQENFFNDIFAGKDENEETPEEEEIAEDEPEEIVEPASTRPHAEEQQPVYFNMEPQPQPTPSQPQPQRINPRRIKGGRKVEIKFEVRKGQAKTEGYVAIGVTDLNTNERLFTKNLPVYPEMLNTPVVIRQETAQNIPFGFKVFAEKTKSGTTIPLIHFDYPADMEIFTVQPIGFLGNSPIWQLRYGIAKSGDAKHESVIYPGSQIKIKESAVINTTEEGYITLQDK